MRSKHFSSMNPSRLSTWSSFSVSFSASATSRWKKAVIAVTSWDWTRRAIMARSWPRSSSSTVVIRAGPRWGRRVSALSAVRADGDAKIGGLRRRLPLPSDLHLDLALTLLLGHFQLELQLGPRRQAQRALAGLQRDLATLQSDRERREVLGDLLERRDPSELETLLAHVQSPRSIVFVVVTRGALPGDGDLDLGLALLLAGLDLEREVAVGVDGDRLVAHRQRQRPSADPFGDAIQCVGRLGRRRHALELELTPVCHFDPLPRPGSMDASASGA